MRRRIRYNTWFVYAMSAVLAGVVVILYNPFRDISPATVNPPPKVVYRNIDLPTFPERTSGFMVGSPLSQQDSSLIGPTSPSATLETEQTISQDNMASVPELDNQTIADSQEQITAIAQSPGVSATRDPYDNSRISFTKQDGLDRIYAELNIRPNRCYGSIYVISHSKRTYTDNLGREVEVGGYVESAETINFDRPSCVADPTDEEQLSAFIKHLTELRK